MLLSLSECRGVFHSEDTVSVGGGAADSTLRCYGLGQAGSAVFGCNRQNGEKPSAESGWGTLWPWLRGGTLDFLIEPL